jgi:hypothetical protein
MVIPADLSGGVPVSATLASELPEGSPFAAREVIAGKAAKTLARETLRGGRDLAAHCQWATDET